MSPWSRKSKTSTWFLISWQFSRVILLMTMLPFSLLDFSGFRFCVINHVSAPKLLSLISVTCPKGTRKAHIVPYNKLWHHLWDSLAPSVYTLLCNPVGPGQFCALPSECVALWQNQQLNVSVCHASSAVDMLGAQVTTRQHLSCHCWKPCTISMPVFMVLHILHTLSPTGATYITHKNRNTFILQSLPWFRTTICLQSDVLMLSTHSCTMTQSTCANYMLQSAVPWYYFRSDMLLPYFLKLPSVPVRGRKLKIWYKEHTHNREYK